MKMYNFKKIVLKLYTCYHECRFLSAGCLNNEELIPQTEIHLSLTKWRQLWVSKYTIQGIKFQLKPEKRPWYWDPDTWVLQSIDPAKEINVHFKYENRELM